MDVKSEEITMPQAAEESAKTIVAAAVKRHPREKFFTTKNMAVVAVFGAIAFVLYMFVKFPLPNLFPVFLDFQISDMPALIAGYMLGPVHAFFIIVIKALLKLPFSSTAGVGELADLIIGSAFVLTATLVFRIKHNTLFAVIGLVCGVFACVAVAALANYAILVPFFVKAFGGWNSVLGAVRGLYPNVTKQNFFYYYTLYAVLPFNLIRAALSAVVTFIAYLSLSRVLKQGFRKKKPRVNIDA